MLVNIKKDMLVLLIVANNHSIQAFSLSGNLLSGATADTQRPPVQLHELGRKVTEVTLSVAWLLVPDGLGRSETADLLGFLHTTSEWSEKHKISSERQCSGQKCKYNLHRFTKI